MWNRGQLARRGARVARTLCLAWLVACARSAAPLVQAPPQSGVRAAQPSGPVPLVIGETFSIDSRIHHQAVVRGAAEHLAAWAAGARTLYLATADAREMQEGAEILLSAVRTVRPSGLVWHYLPLPEEHHRTIYPVAALKAFRTLWPATPQ